jgi:hypothetical protein
MGRVVSAMDMA